MEKIVVDLEVKTNKGIKDVEKLKKNLKDVNKETQNVKKSAKENGEALNQMSGGAVGRLKGLKSGIGGVVKGFKSLKFAIMASGIGALLLAVLAVGKAFTSSEEGQNKFAKIMGVIGSVVGNLVDAFADLGEGIIAAVENPAKAWDSFTNKLNAGYQFIKSQIIDRFGGAWKVLSGGIQAGILKMRIAWNEFTGDSEEADALKDELEDVNAKIIEGAEQIKKANNAVLAVYKEVKKAITSVIDEVVREGVIAAKIADQRAKADKLDRKIITDRAEANRKRAELLDKAVQKEKFTAKERIAFLTEAGRIEDEITAKEVKAAKLRYDSKVAENALSKSTKEDLLEEANLKANLINLETAKLSKQKAVSAQIVGAKREEAAEIKAIEDKAIADKKAIQELEANTEEEKRALALQKEKEKFDEAIALAIEQGLSTEELERSQKESIQLMRDGFAEIDNGRDIKAAADKKVIDDKAVADAKVISDAKIDIAKKEEAAKKASLNGYASALSSISGVLGQQTEEGKAIAIASSLVNTYASISGQLKAFSGVPVPGYAIAQAIATGVVGFANVKKIASVKIPKSSGGGGGGASGSAPSIPSAPPAFNVVGASETSQLADSIGSQSQEPTRAYVVSADVTTSQEMDRNTIEGASI